MPSPPGRRMLAPSLLSADFSDLASAVRAAERGGADAFHLDVMDGHFVPNISFGPALVKAVRRRTTLPLDIHLMISEPGRYLAEFAKAGGTTLVMHIESQGDHKALVKVARDLKVRPGIALSPDTPLESVVPLLSELDELTVMGVYPGFSGQQYIPSTTGKLRQARRLIQDSGRSVDLSIDGGITVETAREATMAGANFFVCGSSVFGGPGSPEDNLRALRGSIADGPR